MNYSIVIATCGRPDALAITLKSIVRQTVAPEKVVIIDASPDDQSAGVTESFNGKLNLHFEKCRDSSAARQRNRGSEHVNTPLIAFIDDDVKLNDDLFEKLIASFAQNPGTGGVAARIRGFGHRPPRKLLWWYYRFQAGFRHPHYGARLFGPGINCLPCYEEDDERELVPSDWLNSGCVIFRASVFRHYRFPDFDGYSFMEDVYLSGQMARTHDLYFHKTAIYDHFPQSSSAKKDRYAIAAMRIRNQARVARDILGMSGLTLHLKFFVYRFFVGLALFRQRQKGWARELFATFATRI